MCNRFFILIVLVILSHTLVAQKYQIIGSETEVQDSLIMVHFKLFADDSIDLGLYCSKDSMRTLVTHLWEYDPTSNRWTRKADFEGKAIYSAVGFSIGNKGYIGLDLYRDFWEYDPATNRWTQKADFTGAPRPTAVGFSIGNKGYIGTGGYSTFPNEKDFWEFMP
jgi:N-acetylneuraminic acid mutarotase